MSVPRLSRRDVLRGSGALLLGSALAACTAGGSGGTGDPAATGSPSASGWRDEPGARWTGHRPGRIYLGMAAMRDLATAEAEVGGPVGVHRTFYQWAQQPLEQATIRADHAAGRLPWVSFKPPEVGEGVAWAAVADGEFDEDVRDRARAYAELSAPVLATFHHEPHNDDDGTPADFAAAWTRIHDVMAEETDLQNVCFPAIVGDWQFNPKNVEADPGAYLTGDVLDRSRLLGVDVYQNGSGEGLGARLDAISAWLAASGHPDLPLGIGETGCTDAFGFPTAAQWWTSAWQWAERNADRLGVVAYFNSSRNTREGLNWRLDESPTKLEAFRRSVRSTITCQLA